MGNAVTGGVFAAARFYQMFLLKERNFIQR